MDASKSFIRKEIFRTSRNIFLVNFILLTIVISLLVGKIDPLHNRINGPFEITLSEINKSIESKWMFFNVKQNYFKLKVNRTYDPKQNAEITTITKRRRHSSVDSKTIKVSAKYIVGQIGETLLLIKVNSDFETSEINNSTSFNGMVSDFPGEIDDFPSMLPLMFDATKQPSSSPYWWFGIGIPLVILFLWQMFKSCIYLLIPTFHHSAKKLSKLGNTKDIMNQIDMEFLRQSESVRISNVTISKTWLVYSEWFSFFVFDISQIRWIYGERYKDNDDGIQINSLFAKDVFINPDNLAWDSKSINILTTSSNDSFTIVVSSKKEASRIIELILDKTNLIMIGYSDELLKYWITRREEILSIIECKEPISQCLEQSKLNLNIKMIRTSKQ